MGKGQGVWIPREIAVCLPRLTLRPPSRWQVFMVVLLTWCRYGCTEARLSIQDICEATGLARRTVQAALAALISLGLVQRWASEVFGCDPRGPGHAGGQVGLHAEEPTHRRRAEGSSHRRRAEGPSCWRRAEGPAGLRAAGDSRGADKPAASESAHMLAPSLLVFMFLIRKKVSAGPHSPRSS